MPVTLPSDPLKKMPARCRLICRRKCLPRCRLICCRKWMRIGARQITCRSGRSICRTIRCSKTPLKLEHIKPRLLGHWGTTPGLNFLYVHLNRLIKENDLNMIYVIGPGHGGPGLVAQTYLEGSYTERYPAIERSRNGLQRLFRQFSWPYGSPAMCRRKLPARSMKAANSAIPSSMPMALLSTIRI